jgi:serine/threonine protein kinase
MAPEPADDAQMPADVVAELRAAIAAGGGRGLGSGYQASVRLVPTARGDVVVKSAHRGRWLGWLWRALLRREHTIYARLRGIEGIPAAFGLVDGEHLGLEYVAGPSLREYEGRIADRDAFFARLRRTLEAMHSAGVAHGDLKRKDNIIVAAGEAPHLIDFGVAVRRSGTSALWNRLVFEPLRQMDLNAWIKLKYGRRIVPAADAEILAAADAAIYRPLLIERIARAVRVPWQTLTLRRPRQRWRARRK